ncbi:MAG: hypothetical protein Q9194_000587 [Teloschistes cf. exilis]
MSLGTVLSGQSLGTVPTVSDRCHYRDAAEGPEGSSNIDALSPLLILSKLLEPHEKTNCGVGNLGEGLLGVRCPWAFA